LGLVKLSISKFNVLNSVESLQARVTDFAVAVQI
jgi:hypothetical protein